MSVKTTFSVYNDLPVVTTNHVLVFLKPVNASQNFQYAAWRDLNPPQGGFAPFDYVIDLSVNVFDPSPNGASSRIYPIDPGELFEATNLNTQGPDITPKDIGGGQVTPSQAAILNGCANPVARIGINWYNTGSLIVRVGAVPNDIINLGKVVTLELEPTLYFMAADQTLIGPNFTLQDYSQMTPYLLKAGVTEVKVTWSRDNNGLGKDSFDFTPPSGTGI